MAPSARSTSTSACADIPGRSFEMSPSMRMRVRKVEMSPWRFARGATSRTLPPNSSSLRASTRTATGCSGFTRVTSISSTSA